MNSYISHLRAWFRDLISPDVDLVWKNRVLPQAVAQGECSAIPPCSFGVTQPQENFDEFS
jgi:hypothetical protein